MSTAMKGLLALVLTFAMATSVSAQAAGNWQNVHGQVQAVHGDRLTLKADDGRIIEVDIREVSPSVRAAMEPNLRVTVSGFPVTSHERFTARYIVQDNAGAAPPVAAAPGPSAVAVRILPLVPQFVDSREFRDRAAGFRHDPRAAGIFVTRLYRGFFEREPGDDERRFWVRNLRESGDVRGTVEAFVRSPEYAAKNKNDREAITDLYQALFDRTPLREEVRSWEHQIARR